MRFVKVSDARKALKDINPRPAPKGMPTARWREGEPSGYREDKTLAWYRGHHAGIWDAYLTIKAEHPRVAEKFRKAAGLTKDGALGEDA